DAFIPIPFAFFSDLIGSVNSSGGFTYQDNSGNYFGGFNSSGGVLTQGLENGNLDNIAVQFGLRYDF
ncbi:MAG: hypothetical protein AAGA81_12115, partial [Acidobacteriota bacterium]